MKKLLTYPIKWLLRPKVARYKKELEQIKARAPLLIIKRRLPGTNDSTMHQIMRDIYLKIKYEQFIKKWTL